jgi:hypothetical protein
MEPSQSLFLAERYVPAGSPQLVADDVVCAKTASFELAHEGTTAPASEHNPGPGR